MAATTPPIELSSIDASDDKETTPLLNKQLVYGNPNSNPPDPDAYRFNLICILCFLSGLYFTNESTFKMNTDSAGESGDRIENNVTTGNTGTNGIRNKTEKTNSAAIWFIGGGIFIVHVLFHLTNLSLGSMIEICRIANNSPYICEKFPGDYNKSNCLLPQEYWKFSVATTIASFGSFISYLLITVYILIPMNGNFCKEHCELPRDDKNNLCCHVCCLAHRKAFKQNIISPFTSSSKCTVEDVCFYFHYAIVLIFFRLCADLCYCIHLCFQKSQSKLCEKYCGHNKGCSSISWFVLCHSKLLYIFQNCLLYY